MHLRRYPAARSSTFCKNAYVATHLEALYLQALEFSRDESGEKVRLNLASLLPYRFEESQLHNFKQ
jgi:hypothetical protein